MEKEFPRDYYEFDVAHLKRQYDTLYNDMVQAYELANDVPVKEADFDAIFVLGLGGSSISGAFLQTYFRHLNNNIPVHLVQDYDLPPYVTGRSLVIAISYSGNTEETVNAYRQAVKITQHTYAFSTGGKIEEVANIGRYAFIKVPKGYQPRTAAISYLFFPVLRLLERLNILPSHREQLQRTIQSLKKTSFEDIGIQLSEKLMYTTPLFYASDKYWPVAYRAKTQINEHAKIHSFWHKFPELNHNELCGYTKTEGNYHIVTFRFDDDHRRVQKRMDITKEVAKKVGVNTTEVKLTGDSYLTKLLSAVLIGDFSAYYLALRYQQDPSPVVVIEDFKKELGPFI